MKLSFVRWLLIEVASICLLYLAFARASDGAMNVVCFSTWIVLILSYLSGDGLRFLWGADSPNEFAREFTRFRLLATVGGMAWVGNLWTASAAALCVLFDAGLAKASWSVLASKSGDSESKDDRTCQDIEFPESEMRAAKEELEKKGIL